ncbi:MAG TPA: FIST N-terminal domain-containing protein [Myxococcota bacterium]
MAARTVHIADLDAERAARDLRAALPGPLDLVLFYCSAAYDLEALQNALRVHLADVSCVVGCTSAGQIGPGGFTDGGLTAVGFRGGSLVATPWVIEPLHNATQICGDIGAQVLEQRRQRPEHGAFGLLLVDGLAHAEEHLTASLYAALGDVPLVGGSAGDDLSFTATHVYVDGTFRSDRAIFVLVETRAPFSTFRFQHFLPSGRRVVVTGADPARRIIHSIDGRPALSGYAEALGMRAEQITPQVWSAHPLLVTIGGEAHIRSIKRVLDDGAFELLCAIERGVVLRIGTSTDPIEAATTALAAARARVERPAVVLGYDCILRRLEFAEHGQRDAIGAVYADNDVVGFSTYGEQWNSVHVNQTFTGVVIGGRRD